jgi:uncharacterized protein YndB with AHSA1/START domain
MRKFILIVLAVIVVGVAVFAGVVAMQPADFHIARSANIAAPPSDVFAQVNDFHKWEAWSPWLKLDPAAKTTYEGPAAGTGAIFKWSGNSEVGAGAMTLTESRPNELIKIKLDFEQPFKDTSAVEFTFQPEGTQTVVTWNMSGPRTFVTKAIALVLNMDKMIGDRFDEGLANMKSVVEAKKEQGTDGKQ